MSNCGISPPLSVCVSHFLNNDVNIFVANPQCKDHSHGPHHHHGRSWPNMYEDKDILKEQNALHFEEDCSNFDIVKATQ